MPDLRQLRAFVAVAEEANFTRAAGVLHLAQQAVSRSVAQLERELGVELLERTTREVRLTPAGAALLQDGRKLLTAADAAFARAREVGHGLSGTVRVGMSPAVGPHDGERAVAALREGAAGLAVSLLEVRPRDVERLLRDREVDLVLARTARTGPAIDSAALAPSPAVLALPEGHRLAGREAVGLAELDGRRLLVWSAPGTPYTDLLVARLAAAGASVELVEARITGSAGLTELAERDAVALVPGGWPPAGGLVYVPLREEVTLPLMVLWPAGFLPPAVRRLRDGMAGGG